MKDWIIENIQWILTSALGLIVWLIRLEGKVKAMETLFEQKLTAQEKIIDHLTKAGENIKETLGTIQPQISAINTKLDFLIKEYQK